jgi:hypothetical protein
MSIKLTDTQLVLLGAAGRRKDLCLVAPPTLKGATAQKVASKLIAAGFVREVKAKSSNPIWRDAPPGRMGFIRQSQISRAFERADTAIWLLHAVDSSA